MRNNKIVRWFLDLFAVTRREFMLSFHDEGVFIFFVVLCATYPVLYSLIYNTETAHDVKVVVVDDSRSQLSREFVRELDATQEVAVMDYVSNMQDARRLMNEKECYGILYIPRDFSTAIGRGEQGHVSVYCDMGVMMRYKQILTAVTGVQMNVSGKLQAKQLAVLSNNTGTIVESEQVALGNTAKGIASAVLPCILILVLQQSMLLGICMLRGGSRERRLTHKGVDPLTVDCGAGATVIGKMLCHLMIYIVPTVYVLHYVPMFFDFPQNGNTLDIAVMVLPFLIATSFMGQSLQALVNDRESTFLVVAFTSVIFVFLSGVSWPRYEQSALWLAIGNAVPSTWAVENYVSMHTLGATLDQLKHPYAMLWVLVGVYFMIAYVVERFLLRPRYRRMQHYASFDAGALLKEEYHRNAVDVVPEEEMETKPYKPEE